MFYVESKSAPYINYILKDKYFAIACKLLHKVFNIGWYFVVIFAYLYTTYAKITIESISERGMFMINSKLIPQQTQKITVLPNIYGGAS